jgi:hypothetical protein
MKYKAAWFILSTKLFYIKGKIHKTTVFKSIIEVASDRRFTGQG